MNALPTYPVIPLIAGGNKVSEAGAVGRMT